MQICKTHWDKLRAEIKDLGLDHLVAKSGEEAAANLVEELQGGDSKYDPLMSCHNMILGNALQRGGLYLMGLDENGAQYCPICEAVKHGAQESDWIKGPAHAAQQYARELKLIPEKQ